MERYTASRPRLGEHLEVIKFICKEFWHELFRKQVDARQMNRLSHASWLYSMEVSSIFGDQCK